MYEMMLYFRNSVLCYKLSLLLFVIHQPERVACNGRSTSTLVLPNQAPLIIWWSGTLNFNDHPKDINCGQNVCFKTRNRTWIHSSHRKIILFYGTDLDPEDLPLPKLPMHQWALFHEESPMNNYMLVHKPFIRLFNHTATFQRDSNFPITTQHIPSAKYLYERRPVSLAEKNRWRKEEGIAPILYVQSHCDVPSDRDRYVKELVKYIEIDSYGKCLNNKPMPEHLTDPVESMTSETFLNFISKYKFHIAFENAICDDYITEKLYRSVHVGSVPIYRGSSSASEWMPNDLSIIMADKFESPKDLADFISNLDKNDSQYEEYLKYKIDGIENELLEDTLNNRPWGEDTDHDFISGFECYLCNKVSQRQPQGHSESLNLEEEKEFHHPLNCPQPYPSVGEINDLPYHDSWQRMNWIEDYWTGYDKARAVQRMIESGEKDPSKFEQYLLSVFKNNNS